MASRRWSSRTKSVSRPGGDREAYPKGKQSPCKPGDCFALLAVTTCVEFIEQEFNLTLSNYSGCHCEGVCCPKQSRVEQEKACFGRLLHSQKALVRSDTPVSSAWLNSYERSSHDMHNGFEAGCLFLSANVAGGATGEGIPGGGRG
jgi:hypothetical protein